MFDRRSDHLLGAGVVPGPAARRASRPGSTAPPPGASASIATSWSSAWKTTGSGLNRIARRCRSAGCARSCACCSSAASCRPAPAFPPRSACRGCRPSSWRSGSTRAPGWASNVVCNSRGAARLATRAARPGLAFELLPALVVQCRRVRAAAAPSCRVEQNQRVHRSNCASSKRRVSSLTNRLDGPCAWRSRSISSPSNGSEVDFESLRAPSPTTTDVLPSAAWTGKPPRDRDRSG